MRHLVTGGSGFLGNLIARRLAEQGDQVRVLDIWRDQTQPRDIEFVQCDIRDRLAVRRAMEGVDIVHHNVALVPLTKSGAQFWEVNVDGSRLAAEEAVRAGVRSFIHMSSSAIFGVPQECPIGPTTPLRPIEIYGRGKLAGEQVVREVCGAGGVPLIVIRPRTILGLGRMGIFQILFEWIREGRDVYVIGSGNVLFQFVHAHDLMAFYMLALSQAQPGDYNVGAEEFGMLRSELESLIQYAGSPSKVRSLPERLSIATLRTLDLLGLSPLAPWHYLTYHKAFHFDVAPLRRLGWHAQYSNQAMLRESYDWFVKNAESMRQEESASPHRKPVRQKVLRLLKKFS